MDELDKLAFEMIRKANSFGLKDFARSVERVILSDSKETQKASNLGFLIGEFKRTHPEYIIRFRAVFKDYDLWCRAYNLKHIKKRKLTFTDSGNGLGNVLGISLIVFGSIILVIGLLRKVFQIYDLGYNYLLLFVFTDGTHEFFMGLAILLSGFWVVRANKIRKRLS